MSEVKAMEEALQEAEAAEVKATADEKAAQDIVKKVKKEQEAFGREVWGGVKSIDHI